LFESGAVKEQQPDCHRKIMGALDRISLEHLPGLPFGSQFVGAFGKPLETIRLRHSTVVAKIDRSARIAE
jgi:hypothetical protein